MLHYSKIESARANINRSGEIRKIQLPSGSDVLKELWGFTSLPEAVRMSALESHRKLRMDTFVLLTSKAYPNSS